MKVVFVASGNRDIGPIISAQADSLREIGIQVDVFPIIGKGLYGYLKNIRKLRAFIKERTPDLVHAHYSLSGIIASLATRKPVITSLMGSDVKQPLSGKKPLLFFIKHIWRMTIVKSEDSKKTLQCNALRVLPNGVNMHIFHPMAKDFCQRKLGWAANKKHVLFVSQKDIYRPEKNLELANSAIQQMELYDVELQAISGIPHSEMPVYLNACDALLLTSKWEGSPNIVKEAMACNVPVVAVEVGDIRWLFGDLAGYFLAKPSSENIAKKLIEAFEFEGKTSGRERIISLQLDSLSVAGKLKDMYAVVAKK